MNWRARTGLYRIFIVLALLVAVLAWSGSARADEYDAKRAGHPLRVVAYMLHPVGVLLDYAIFRPAHWLGQHELFRTIFGHTD